jgi:hypothetical protein
MTNDERIANICDDPRASVSALAWLKEQDPIAALRHPNCPAELWWELAAEYPVEAQESVLYQLVTLENPGRWSKLESDNFKAWITSASDWLTWEQQHLFVADCEEHFLYMYGDQDTELIAKRKEVIRTRRVWQGRGDRGATECPLGECLQPHRRPVSLGGCAPQRAALAVGALAAISAGRGLMAPNIGPGLSERLSQGADSSYAHLSTRVKLWQTQN